jgi:D-alanine-D-alanine ligase
MKKLRVLALMHKELVPPEDTTGRDVATADWKTEHDVSTAIRDLGHELLSIGLGDELRGIRRTLDEWKPHIVFNLLENFHDVPVFDQNVVAYLELLRVPYTGCNPRGLLLARDKALSKKVLVYHRIPTPAFTVVQVGRSVRSQKRLTFPVIVKSLTQEASTGISQASVVSDEEKLRERVTFIHENVGTDAIVEHYVEGRELYVGMLGNQRLDVFPVWEMLFGTMSEGLWPIATDRVKFSRRYQEKHGIRTEESQKLPEGVADHIRHVCKRVYRTLGLSGYARIDLRMDTEGRVYVLEANPNPQLAFGEDFAEAAKRAGISYEGLIQRIISLGLRWRPERPTG